jgi:hypothetical protein
MLLLPAYADEAETKEGEVAPLIELDETKQEEVRILEFVHGLPNGERAIFLKRLDALQYSPPFGNAEGGVNTLEVEVEGMGCAPMVPISNEAECKEAARLNGIEYEQTEERSTGGDPICRESGGGVYFNSDGAQKGDKILCGTKRCPASCVSKIRMRNLRFEGFAVCEEERECKHCEYCQSILQQLGSVNEDLDLEEDAYTSRAWNVDCELKTLQKRHPKEQHQFIAELMADTSNHSTETRVVPPSKRIAVVLRGETFRGGATIQNRRDTPRCAESSVAAQLDIARKYKEYFDSLTEEGYTVDAFLATYPCPDHTSPYVWQMGQILGDYLKRSLLLNANENTLVAEQETEMEKMSDGYTQADSLQAAVHLVEEHMLQFQLYYDFLFVLRADHEVNAKRLPGCLLQFGKPVELGGEDYGQAIPRKYLPCYFKKVREYAWSLCSFPEAVASLRAHLRIFETDADIEALQTYRKHIATPEARALEESLGLICSTDCQHTGRFGLDKKDCDFTYFRKA